MFTACESGRELVSDAGTARRQTENKAVKPHAAYVEFRKQEERNRVKGKRWSRKIWGAGRYVCSVCVHVLCTLTWHKAGKRDGHSKEYSARKIHTAFTFGLRRTMQQQQRKTQNKTSPGQQMRGFQLGFNVLFQIKYSKQAEESVTLLTSKLLTWSGVWIFAHVSPSGPFC